MSRRFRVYFHALFNACLVFNIVSQSVSLSWVSLCFFSAFLCSGLSVMLVAVWPRGNELRCAHQRTCRMSSTVSSQLIDRCADTSPWYLTTHPGQLSLALFPVQAQWALAEERLSSWVEVSFGSIRLLAHYDPCSRVSKTTPAFTGRVDGPCRRPVNTGSAYQALI